MEYYYTYLFWGSFTVLLFAYILYPAISQLLAAISPQLTKSSDKYKPEVTVILVVHNEEKRLSARVNNLLASDYPMDKLSIVVVDDGSTDGTEILMSSINILHVKYIRFESKEGKPSRLSSVVPTVSGEICVLCDARQTFAPDAIKRLACAFSDPMVGAVSGELHIAASESNIGQGIDRYWSRERRLREAEAKRHSSIGCTGAIYAIRRSLFSSIRSDTILDDVVIPLQISAQNYRVLHDAKACAFDSQPLEPIYELRRKRRTLAGNFQMLFRHPRWLFPWGHPLWWRIIAHKYLRILAPAFLCILGITSLLLSDIFTYRLVAVLQGIAYFFGIIGLLTKSRVFILSIPSAFLFLNYIVVLAFWDFLFSRVSARWETGSAVIPKT